MLNFGRLIVVMVACLVAAAADAQTIANPPRAFVDVSVGPDWDDAYRDSTRVPGATWESGFAFGFDWGKSGVEFDVGVPRWHVKNFAPRRYQHAGQSFGWERQGHFYESSDTERRRSIDATVLYRANVPVKRHVTVSWLVGGGFVYRPEQFTSVTKEVLPDGQLAEVNTLKDTSSRNYLAATVGLDVEFRVSRQVAVVPRLRVTAFPSLLDDSSLAPRMLGGRPEIAVRCGF
jgi:hypothetical protein